MYIIIDLSEVIVIIIIGLPFSGCGREGRHLAFASFSRSQKTVCGILMLDFWYGLVALLRPSLPHG
jgi:hypothetical protein